METCVAATVLFPFVAAIVNLQAKRDDTQLDATSKFHLQSSTVREGTSQVRRGSE